MDNTEDITVLSLCAGYGGLELALSAALERVLRVVAVEIEAYALANLVAKAEQNKLAIEALYPDIKTFPAKRFSGCFDILIAGFPCQPFSVAGKGQGGNDPRHLWPYIAGIIKAVKPVRVFLENVPGLLSTGTLDNRPDLQEHLAQLGEAEKRLDARGKWYLSQHRQRLANYWVRTEGIPAYGAIYYSLKDLGYSVETGLFTAAEVGAPHKRERLFILAELDNSSCRRYSEEKEICTGWDGIISSSQLANALCNDGGEIQPYGKDSQSPEPVGNGSKGRIRELANSDGSGCKQQRRAEPIRPEYSTAQYGGSRWPSRPGQEQYDWEEPRTVEPGMGRTVDGFASRVDELRLLGNGVVWRCAKKALIQLLGDKR